MNSYSVLARNESARPPCQPASPVPPRTASSSPFSCSGVELPHRPRLNDEREALHLRRVPVGVQRVGRPRPRTPAPSATGAKTSTVSFGWWPGHPPHTISTRFGPGALGGHAQTERQDARRQRSRPTTGRSVEYRRVHVHLFGVTAPPSACRFRVRPVPPAAFRPYRASSLIQMFRNRTGCAWSCSEIGSLSACAL